MHLKVTISLAFAFTVMILYIYICLWVSMTTLNSEDIKLFSVRYTGGYIIRFTWCHTDISLYLPVSWLFRMGCHWPHWKLKSSLWALAVLNRGGYIIRFTWCHTDISLYLPIIWLFRMGAHWPHWKVKSSLWGLAVSNGGVNRQCEQVDLKIWKSDLYSCHASLILGGPSVLPR